jgi:hypothetical protein
MKNKNLSIRVTPTDTKQLYELYGILKDGLDSKALNWTNGYNHLDSLWRAVRVFSEVES